jgi:inorganic pyrophosphatase
MSMASPVRIGPFAKGDHVNVVIETPAGSRTKYTWDPEVGAFRANKVLPLGMTFPYDFGFLPGTHASDGAELDVVVLADAPLAVGCLVECRVLGAFECKTDGERNDRVVAVPIDTIQGARWHHLADIGSDLVDGIGDFLRSYVERDGRRFEMIRRVDRATALALVKAART